MFRVWSWRRAATLSSTLSLMTLPHNILVKSDLWVYSPVSKYNCLTLDSILIFKTRTALLTSRKCVSVVSAGSRFLGRIWIDTSKTANASLFTPPRMHKRPKWSSFRLWRAVTKWAPVQSMTGRNLEWHLQSHHSEWIIRMKTWDQSRVNKYPSGSKRVSRFAVPLEVQIRTVPISTTWRIALSILKSKRLSTTESSAHTARECSQMTQRRDTSQFVKGMRSPAN